MEFLPENINVYTENHTQAESEVLSELNRETWSNVIMPRMLSGHLQGRVLSVLSKMINPNTILEIGTYTGYSALCLAEGLAPDGMLITIDVNEELEDLVRKYIGKANLSDRIEFKVGNAMEIIPTLDIKPELVFIDADKENYLNYYKLVIDKMPSGGIVIADNVLWSGKVTLNEGDEETEAIKQFNEFVHHDERVENVLFPIRDGLMIVRKI